MPTLALLDGHSLAYRAFFALPPDLATKSGQVTNSAYGFTSMLIKMLGDHRPDAVLVTWDSGRTTFRTEVYPDYKAQRERAPDDFKSQLPLIGEVLEALQIRQVELPGFEADDLIATMARRASEEGWDVLVVTGDRDAFQLIDERVSVLYTRRGISDTVLADSEWVEGKYNIRPDQYVEYASLRGDNSDNLPGVPGVGEKTAAKLIGAYGGLEEIYENLDEMTPKLRQNLANNREQVFLNQRLMALVTDLDLEIQPDELKLNPFDRATVKDVFETLEFHSLWDRLLEVEQEDISLGPLLEVEVRSATSRGALAGIGERPRLAVLQVRDHAGFQGLMVAADDDQAVFVTTDNLQLLQALLADPEVPKVTHDAKSLLRALGRRGIELAGVESDVSIAAYLLNPSSRTYDIAELASQYAGVEIAGHPEEEVPEGVQAALEFSTGPDLELAAREVVAVERLAGLLAQQLAEREEVELFHSIEMPLVAVLARMEDTGIRVDTEYLEELGESLKDRLAVLEKEIYDDSGEPFNINSTLQLREVLFDRLELPVLKKTSKGAASTDASVLAKLVDSHPVVEKLLKYRELEKLRSTYVDGYLPLVAEDGRIHASFNQVAATTGRLSSENPNLQNIPVRSETGLMIRRAFVPEDGWTFVVADYSQIELRVLAHMTRDERLVEAFTGEQADVHTTTAAGVFDVEPEHVTKEMRRMAKVINFGLIYGMEAFGLAERLKISREEAAAYIEAYFERFPGVQEFRTRVVAEARNSGYTTTAFGRRRYLPELKSDNYRIRQMGERMALNAPVQGTAADIIKMAMIDLDRELELEGLETAMLLQVHDELVLETPPSELDRAVDLTVAVMERAAKFDVPLKVDVATGLNLAEVKA